MEGEVLPSILPLPPFGGPENQRFHAVSNGIQLTDQMVLNQPYDGSRHGRQTTRNHRTRRLPIKSGGFHQPLY